MIFMIFGCPSCGNDFYDFLLQSLVILMIFMILIILNFLFIFQLLVVGYQTHFTWSEYLFQENLKRCHKASQYIGFTIYILPPTTIFIIYMIYYCTYMIFILCRTFISSLLKLMCKLPSFPCSSSFSNLRKLGIILE